MVFAGHYPNSMTEKFIPLIAVREANQAPAVPAMLNPVTGHLQDSLGRPLHDLRISVTDRCNFRCVYCMPKAVFDKDYPYLAHSDLLSFEEIHRLAAIFVSHGVKKIRLTGGEPLLRKHLHRLVSMLAALRTPDGEALDLTLTTNGALLARQAEQLKQAGLKRVTVSLDALSDSTFRRMNDVDFSVRDVLDGIDAAYQAGLGPIKINMVVKAGMNDQEILPMARYFRDTPHSLRFIEYMDVGATNGWKLDEVIPSERILEILRADGMQLQPLAASQPGETASRWRHFDGSGEIGLISSVTQAFCRDCNRLRLSTEGKLYTCLFAGKGHDLRDLLRSPQGYSDLQIANAIAAIWQQRADRYSELRSAVSQASRPKIEMSYIGG